MTDDEILEEIEIEASERGFNFGSRDYGDWVEAEFDRRTAEPECNGYCTKGNDLGMPEYANTIFAHPDCPLHWDGERCQICGKGYDTVYWLPDEWWARITPKSENPEAGLLCPDCALERLQGFHSDPDLDKPAPWEEIDTLTTEPECPGIFRSLLSYLRARGH